MSVPFHKQTDPAKMAGQHVYGFDREPYLKHSNAAPYEPRVEQTLNEYIARKEEGPKRMTFDEWFNSNDGICTVQNVHNEQSSEKEVYEWLRDLWNDALTKGKL